MVLILIPKRGSPLHPRYGIYAVWLLPRVGASPHYFPARQLITSVPVVSMRGPWVSHESDTVYPIRRCTSHPLGRFSKLDCSTTKRVPIPNDAFSESSHRDVSNADRFGTGSIPTVEISRMENRPRGGGDLHRRIRVHQRETRARPMMGDPINGLCWCIPGITVTHG